MPQRIMRSCAMDEGAADCGEYRQAAKLLRKADAQLGAPSVSKRPRTSIPALKASRITGEAVVLVPVKAAALSVWACVLGQRWVAAEEALG